MNFDTPTTTDRIFCIVPWVEVHIESNGLYGTCGAQHRCHSQADKMKKYNILSMSIDDWVASTYQSQVRLAKVTGVPDRLCGICYHEEAMQTTSKRVRENFKSKISAVDFYPTYNTSPDKYYIEHSKNNNGENIYPKPNSFHVSLGNQCNMACKMCGPYSSSMVASDLRSKGLLTGPIVLDWTRDDAAWTHFVDYVCNNENLQFIHVIGGEPLITHRFEELINALLAANQTNIYFGFTTNATSVPSGLCGKLSKFRYVDIGISIETANELNNYIRVNSKVETILSNIDEYLKYSGPGMRVTLRTVPSALSVVALDDLYKWCIARDLDVMPNVLTFPEHLQIKQLPTDVKVRLLEQYSKWEFSEVLPNGDPRDHTRFKEHIDTDVRAIIQALQTEADPAMTTLLYKDLKDWGWLDDPKISHYFHTNTNV